MGRAIWHIVILAAALLAPACDRLPRASASPRERLEGTLVLTGSNTMASLLREIGDCFQVVHPGVKIEVCSSGSAQGLNELRDGRSDIAMCGRAVRESEGDLFGFPIARDGISLAVHRENPVRSLREEQVKAIYRGEVLNWKEVGGLDAPITVISRAKGQSQFHLFTDYFRLQDDEINAHLAAEDNEAAIQAVTADARAIVYLSIGLAEQKAREGLPIKLLPLGGIESSIKSVRNGSFPISRPLTLVTRDHPRGLLKAFIDFSLSSQVTELVLKYNFVPYLD